MVDLCLGLSCILVVEAEESIRNYEKKEKKLKHGKRCNFVSDLESVGGWVPDLFLGSVGGCLIRGLPDLCFDFPYHSLMAIIPKIQQLTKGQAPSAGMRTKDASGFGWLVGPCSSFFFIS